MSKTEKVITCLVAAGIVGFFILGTRWAYFGAGAFAATLLFVTLGKWVEGLQRRQREKAWKDYSEILSGTPGLSNHGASGVYPSEVPPA